MDSDKGGKVRSSCQRVDAIHESSQNLPKIQPTFKVDACSNSSCNSFLFLQR